MALHHGDVGADRDEAAVARAPLVDLQPALVGKLHFRRLRDAGAVGVRDAALDDRAGGRGMHRRALRAGHENVVRKAVGLLVMRVAHDEPVVLVP